MNQNNPMMMGFVEDKIMTMKKTLVVHGLNDNLQCLGFMRYRSWKEIPFIDDFNQY